MQAHGLPSPYWVATCPHVAQALGWPDHWWQHPDALDIFSGNKQAQGSAPAASVYSGHQFGVWAGQLGDGRALLMGGVQGADGQEWELQLKGSGRTPYSRMGDGRAVLRSSIREYLCSQAMQSLGVPTTWALCITGSDAAVLREDVETAAIVTRVAPSFIRFGHFEHFSAAGQMDALRTLADYVIDRFYPDCRTQLLRAHAHLADNPYAALLQVVSERTAALLAQWQSLGFCHGVMNTDNMSILGLTLDYGPFQFMDNFDPRHICNHSDSQGRYAYSRQPQVAYWNLFCLAQALLPLLPGQEVALAALETYKSSYERAFIRCMTAKLGLQSVQSGDTVLIDATLNLLAKYKVDYTAFWRRLSHWVAGGSEQALLDLFQPSESLQDWMRSYRQRLQAESADAAAALMLSVNPAHVLRNHLAQQAIERAQQGDYSAVSDLQQALTHPFDDDARFANYAALPPQWASSIQISCSS